MSSEVRSIASAHDQGSHRDSLNANCSSINHEVPAEWPEGVQYLSEPAISPFLSETQRKWLLQKPQDQSTTDFGSLPSIVLPMTRGEIDGRIKTYLINDSQHPADGQRGLFAARDFSPGDMIIPYIGYIHSSTASERLIHLEQGLEQRGQDSSIGTWDSSSYDLNLHRDEDVELAIDAATQGNEARFCNDYRGVPAQNVSQTEPVSWDRKAKRRLKASHSYETSDLSSTSRFHTSPECAIPNAEFRDVWLSIGTEDAGIRGHGEQRAETTLHVQEVDSAQQDMLPTRPQPPSSDATKTNKSIPLEKRPRDGKQQRRQERRKRKGMRGVAIFVLPAGKGGKRKIGIKAGQEILVSYGKGFWSHHQTHDSKASAEERLTTACQDFHGTEQASIPQSFLA